LKGIVGATLRPLRPRKLQAFRSWLGRIIANLASSSRWKRRSIA